VAQEAQPSGQPAARAIHREAVFTLFLALHHRRRRPLGRA
jgi:hypothetical protein